MSIGLPLESQNTFLTSDRTASGKQQRYTLGRQSEEVVSSIYVPKTRRGSKRSPDPYLPGRVFLSAGAPHSWETRNGTTTERSGRLFGLARAARKLQSKRLGRRRLLPSR